MIDVRIQDRGCRGCTLCVDLCPVDVFDFDEGRQLALVARAQDCIGCLSCRYACPSACIEVDGIEELRPFHRFEGHARLIERFLQARPAATTLTDADWEEAYRDVAARLHALGAAVVETMGRGHRPVGRRAGAVAAAHMPEVYDHQDLDHILQDLRRQLGGAFDDRHRVDGNVVELEFEPCALCEIVRNAGQTVGEGVLCELFHEYLAGLLSEHAGVPYRFEVPLAGDRCQMRLFPAR
jgi:ferredoxin